MAIKFEGQVLRGVRYSPQNEPETALPVSGVSRDVKRPPEDRMQVRKYNINGEAEAETLPVDLSGDQYRSSFLYTNETSTEEYIFWAANNSQLNIIENPEEGDDSWVYDELLKDRTGATPSYRPFPIGSIPVVQYKWFTNSEDPDAGAYAESQEAVNDGTRTVIIRDAGKRTLSDILTIRVRRGDWYGYGKYRFGSDEESFEAWRDVENDDDVRVNLDVEFTKEDFEEIDAEAGTIKIKEESLLEKGFGRIPGYAGPEVAEGCFSQSRGDYLHSATYTLAAARFFWTKNDKYQTRFQFNGKSQSWEPIKGSSVLNLGPLLADQSYILKPPPTVLSYVDVGSKLPGSPIESGSADAYCMVRIGTIPNSSSVPLAHDPNDEALFSGIRVVKDDQTEGYAFTGSPALAAVVGETTGIIKWNPDFLRVYAGQNVWYNFPDFQKKANGYVGKLETADEADLFISPIPGPTDYPLLKIGNRRYLKPFIADSEAELNTLPVASGQVGISLSTGRLKFSETDINKCLLDSDLFEKPYLGAVVYYDGVALNGTPQPTKAPVKVENSGGGYSVSEENALYLPLADPYGGSGLGVSGMLQLPDKTGLPPYYTDTLQPSAKPGGDSSSKRSTGLVRKFVEFGTLPSNPSGTAFFFNRHWVSTNIYEKHDSEDMNKPWEIGGSNYVHLLTSSSKVGDVHGYSKVEFGNVGSRSPRQLSQDHSTPIYFLQPTFTPSIYLTKAKLYSRVKYNFTLNGDEILYFKIDGVSYTWESSSLDLSLLPTPVADFPATFPVGLIVDSLNELVGDGEDPIASDLNGQIVLSAKDPLNGSVEIGFGAADAGKDLSGCSALGFLPGWYVNIANDVEDGEEPSTEYWVADSGFSFTLRRNWNAPTGYLSGSGRFSKSVLPDFMAHNSIDAMIVKDVVDENPFQQFDFPPLLDMPGFDSDVFFQLYNVVTEGGTEKPIITYLREWDQIKYEFGLNRFAWIEDNSISVPEVRGPINRLPLGKTNILPESLLSAKVFDGYSGLNVAEGGSSPEVLQKDVDYLLPGNPEGSEGAALLIEKVNKLYLYGAQGSFEEGGDTFIDPSVAFVGGDNQVGIGYYLKVAFGSSAGWYLIKDITDDDELKVRPSFPSGSGEDAISWEIYEGVPDKLVVIDDGGDVVLNDLGDPIYTGNYDQSILVDSSYDVFNHLPEEPFKIRVLSLIGLVADAGPHYAPISDALRSGREVSVRYAADNDYNLSHQHDDFWDDPSAVPNYAEVRILGAEDLGVLDDGLFVPGSPSSSDQDTFRVKRWNTKNFFLQIGSIRYLQGDEGQLKGVDSFTPSDSFDPDDIEYRNDTGELKFGENILLALSGRRVFYVEDFLDISEWDDDDYSIEVNPITEEVRFGKFFTNLAEDWSNDVMEPVEIRAYFVERMITERRKDVSVSPMTSSFGFMKPTAPDKIIEVEYYQSNSSGGLERDVLGNPVHHKEFLPLFIRGEEAVRVDAYTYTFCGTEIEPGQDGRPYTIITPSNKTIAINIEPSIYANNVLQNHGFPTLSGGEGVIEYPGMEYIQDGVIKFLDPVEEGRKVKITYGVYETNGGEISFTGSSSPLYRPPFFLPEGVDTFKLQGDRTEDIEVGKLMKLGYFPFYVKVADYYDGSDEANTYFDSFGAGYGDVTVVTIFPTPTTGVGTLSPGNDVETLLTATPITMVVDPEDPVYVSPDKLDSVPGGLLLPVSMVDHPFDPVPRGGTEIVFKGNFLRFAVGGHLLELSGHPYIIAGSELSEDGSRTFVRLLSAFVTAYSPGEDEARISVRPIYPVDAMDFIGSNPFFPMEEYELILFGSRDEEGRELPGRSMARGIEYEPEPHTGNVEFIDPVKKPLQPGERVIARYVKQDTIRPVRGWPDVLYPSYNASYLHVTTPSESNRYLGAMLQATYTFHHPDNFYTRLLPLYSFAGETVPSMIKALAPSRAAGGPMMTFKSSGSSGEEGNAGVETDLRDLLDKDRSSRAFLSFYNESIVALEQIHEAITGEVVGDRDGKFRFFVGRGREYAPPGYEDHITGVLNPRNVWFEAWYSLWGADPALDTGTGGRIVLNESDRLVNPDSEAKVSGGKLEGEDLSSGYSAWLQATQSQYIKNDIDDRVITGTRLKFAGFNFPLLWPKFDIKDKGFEFLGLPNIYSRLFPEMTRARLMTYTGIGARVRSTWGYFGKYRFTADNPDSDALFDIVSTFGQTIGRLENSVLGVIERIDDLALVRRGARFRIWKYIPGGSSIPAGSFQVTPGSGVYNSEAIAGPCVIATPEFIKDFPIDALTGYPDVSQLLSYGGEATKKDLRTGHWELLHPPFDWGGGEFVTDSGGNTIGVSPSSKSVVAFGHPNGDQFFVDDGDDGPVCIKDVLYGCVITFGDGGDDSIGAIRDRSGNATEIGKGDTIYIPTGLSNIKAPDPEDDPPSPAELADMIEDLPSYRNNFDVGVLRRKGKLWDLRFPSWDDAIPFPLKEILGQKPPGPGQFLEAMVTFYNNSVSPVEIPALKGEPYDDTGDFKIPFISTTNTEMERFQELDRDLNSLFQTKSPDNSITLIEPTLEEADDGDAGTDNYFYVRELKITTSLAHCLNEGDVVRIDGNSTSSNFPGGGSDGTASIAGILNGLHEVVQVDDEFKFWIRLSPFENPNEDYIEDWPWVYALHALDPGPVVVSDGVIPGSYVYPDETLDNMGKVFGSKVTNQWPSGVLQTEKNPFRRWGSSVGEYQDLGVEDAKPFDLLFVEIPQSQYSGDPAVATPLGQGQGILSVGSVREAETPGSYLIEPPRFVTPTKKGDQIRYNFENAYSWESPTHYEEGVDPNNFSGCQIIVDRTMKAEKVSFLFSSVPEIYFHDGSGTGGTGGLNDIWDNTKDNQIQLKLYRMMPEISDPDGVPDSGDEEPELAGIGETIFDLVLKKDSVSADVPLVLPGAGDVEFGVSEYQPDLEGQEDNREIVFDLSAALMQARVDAGLPDDDPSIGIDDYFDFSQIPLEDVDHSLDFALLEDPDGSMSPPDPEDIEETGDEVWLQKSAHCFDFTISVNCSDVVVPGQEASSQTGFIEKDRLTFNEGFDLKFAKHRDYQHWTVSSPPADPMLDAPDMVARLTITTVASVYGPAHISVNSNVTVNGNLPHTFQDNGGTYGVGTFTPKNLIAVWPDPSGDGDIVMDDVFESSTTPEGFDASGKFGFGTIQVHGWEYANKPIISSPVELASDGSVTFTVASSSSRDELVKTYDVVDRETITLDSAASIEAVADDTGTICRGRATGESKLHSGWDALGDPDYNTADLTDNKVGRWFLDNRLTQVDVHETSVTFGAVSKVKSGDTLVVTASNDGVNAPGAACKVGTYLVRNVMEGSYSTTTADAPGDFSKEPRWREFRLDTTIPTSWINPVFPVLESVDRETREIVISTVGSEYFSDSIHQPCAWDTINDGAPPYGMFSDPDVITKPRLYFIIDGVGGKTKVYSAVYTTDSNPELNKFVVGEDLNLADKSLTDETGDNPEGFSILTNEDTFWDTLTNALDAGSEIKISGMAYLPITLSNSLGDVHAKSLPTKDNNVVGWPIQDDGARQCVHGFRCISISNKFDSDDDGVAEEHIHHIDTNPILNLVRIDRHNQLGDGAYNTKPTSLQIGIDECLPADNTKFVGDANEMDAVYRGVPAVLDFSGMNQIGAGSAFLSLRHPDFEGACCILPDDVFYTYKYENPDGLPYDPAVEDETGSLGFLAQAGIFLEPSFPIQAMPLYASEDPADTEGEEWVVDAAPPDPDGHTLTEEQLSFRYDSELDLNEEFVDFEVRRIRRFSNLQDQVTMDFLPLRYAYEIRRGVVENYEETSSGLITFTASPHPNGVTIGGLTDATNDWGTQLGGFRSEDVNIRVGDTVRIVNRDAPRPNYVVDYAEILTIVDNRTLILKVPGINAGDITGMEFEVYLSKAPVPHEQSNEQLLDLLADKIVFHRKFVTEGDELKGGYVPEFPVPVDEEHLWADVANLLYDDLIDGEAGNSFHALGVLEGDIIVIDPRGDIDSDLPDDQKERGMRPFGDLGVPNRKNVLDEAKNGFEAGKPDDLDDNRGFYRVKKVHADHLEVTGFNQFAGDCESDAVIFPKAASQASKWGYCVYPTISASGLNIEGVSYPPLEEGDDPIPPVEGQMDLRPTKGPDEDGSYLGNSYSIRPFEYLIIRPTTLFTEEAADLILMMRERMLSFIEHLTIPMSRKKSGDYFVFQRDSHISDLGDTTNGEAGRGLYFNRTIFDLVGQVTVAPFANDSDCLSILDRRFWIGDKSLDTEWNLSEGHPFTDYTGSLDPATFPDAVEGGQSVHPLLVDRINYVLGDGDLLRKLRFSWIVYRTHRIKGLLRSIADSERRLDREFKDQRESLMLKDSLGKLFD